MRARWLSAALAVTCVGCAKPAEEWLKDLPSAPVAVDAGVRFDAGEAPLPTLEFRARTGLDTVLEARGLAVHRDTGYTTDRADDHLVAFALGSGAEAQRWPLPERGSPALAWYDGALYLGYPTGIYRFDDGTFTAVEATVDRLEGLAAEADALVTAEAGALYRRDGDRLAPRLELPMSEAAAPFARAGDDYFMVAGFDRPEGQVFETELAVLDATSASGAITRGLVVAPVNAGAITGMASDDSALYLLGAGYGSDAQHVITLEVR